LVDPQISDIYGLNQFPGVLDSGDMIDVQLRLWGWTYSEPARRGLGPIPRPVGLDLQ